MCDVSLLPGAQIDPPELFEPGPVVSANISNSTVELDAGHLGMRSIGVGLNSLTSETTIAVELAGFLPEELEAFPEYWIVVDQDNDKSTGVSAEFVDEFNFSAADFLGAEFVVRINPVLIGDSIDLEETVWRAELGRGQPLDKSRTLTRLSQLTAHPVFVPGMEPPAGTVIDVPIADSLVVTIFEDDSLLSVGDVASLRAYIGSSGEIVNSLNDGVESANVFSLNHPEFAHGFILDENGEATDGIVGPGDLVRFGIDGLVPDMAFHGLLGPGEILFDGVSDDLGNAVLDVRLDDNISLGPHLITVGTDGTAMTADFVMTVVPEPQLSMGFVLLLFLYGFHHTGKSRKQPKK